MPRVTLSFDNSPDPATTPHLLETLRAQRILATFFVIGRNLADPARRSLAERERDEGHWIGNL
jgi:peptidoglycan/xylan/chitin deacetylase (PgdA/CDA1 family)